MKRENISAAESEKREIIDGIIHERISHMRQKTGQDYEYELTKLYKAGFIAGFFLIFSIISLITPDFSLGFFDPVFLPYQAAFDGLLSRLGLPPWVRPACELIAAVVGALTLFRRTKAVAGAYLERSHWLSRSVQEEQAVDRARHAESRKHEALARDFAQRSQSNAAAAQRALIPLFAVISVIVALRALIWIAQHLL